MNREAEIAWAAGLFEGEGSVHSRRVGHITSGRGLSLSMSDLDAVERFAVVCGAHSRITSYRPRPGTKISYRHSITKMSDVHRVLNMLVPYLCERRRADARRVITEIENHRASKADVSDKVAEHRRRGREWWRRHNKDTSPAQYRQA